MAKWQELNADERGWLLLEDVLKTARCIRRTARCIRRGFYSRAAAFIIASLLPFSNNANRAPWRYVTRIQPIVLTYNCTRTFHFRRLALACTYAGHAGRCDARQWTCCARQRTRSARQ